MCKYNKYKSIQWISGSKPSVIPRVNAVGRGIWEPLDKSILEQIEQALQASPGSEGSPKGVG